MNGAFSRWPSHVGKVLPGSATPPWMGTQSGTRRLAGGRWPFEPLLVLMPPMVAAPTIIASTAGYPVLAGLMGVAAGILLMICVASAYRLGRQRMLAVRRHEAAFHNAGVSMWREDWSAVVPEISRLVRDGVHDIEAYYATRPEELRALRRRVTIDDVNEFVLEETKAEGKHVYLGSLDRLLPDTDQTFVQWLVGFARGDGVYRSETHTTNADGSSSDSLFTARLPQHVDDFREIIVTSFDITQYKVAQMRLQTAEHELARASRITTMGALTASIAHEVNSPLAAILANAQAAQRWLRRDTPDIGEAQAAIDKLISEASRARDVVKRTRDFLANTPLRLQAVDILRAARDASLIVEREVRTLGATIHIEATADLPAVHADPVQLQQVLANLLLNAAQALGSHLGSRDIVVSFWRRGAMLVVEVKDSGPGVPEGQRLAIFEPFHTTKPDGMGMGLAICRDCIQALGGKIWVENESGGGASFRFTIPCEE